MKREIIKIDEELCNGCGICIPSCPEGALQIIDGKARLVSDLMCDGLGACIGECPEGAIKIEEREAVPYSETSVIKEILKKGENTTIAHLKHLIDHNEIICFDEAIEYMDNIREDLSFDMDAMLVKVHEQELISGTCASGGCPGSAMKVFPVDLSILDENHERTAQIEPASELRQWPVQMHLINPTAPYFRDADVVLAADCVAFSMGNFHTKYLKGNSLAIACPKLDQGKEIYVEKIRSMIDQAGIRSLHVVVMEVPCCSGLMHIARLASEGAAREIPIRRTVISIKGEALLEEEL